MHAALPYLCPSNYPTLATPLGVTSKQVQDVLAIHLIFNSIVYEILPP